MNMATLTTNQKICPTCQRSLISNDYTPTSKERTIMQFIVDYQSQKNKSPSYREIAFHVKLKGINSVSTYLCRLKSKGYVDFIPAKKRSVQVIKEI